MTILTPNPVSSRQFTYCRDRNEIVGEISSTRGLARVYDDACDVGLTIVSERTGRQVVYAVVGEDRDREGEVQAWKLEAVTPRDRGCVPPLVLLND